MQEFDPNTTPRNSYRARIANLDRWGQFAEANRLRQEMEIVKIRDRARDIAARWPTLTPEQRAIVAAALPPLDHRPGAA
jgi:hypothetical protein